MRARARDHGRWLVPCLVGLMLFVSACASTAGKRTATRTGPPPAQRQVLRVTEFAYGDGWHTLDPALGFDDFEHVLQVFPLLYSGLVTLDARLRPVLWDADRLTISPDGLTYTFHLRSDLRFSDGQPITSADFAYSINRALSPCVEGEGYAGAPEQGQGRHASRLAKYLFDLRDAEAFSIQRCVSLDASPPKIEPYGLHPLIPTLIGDAIETPDAATIILQLEHPNAAFLAQLAFPTSYVVERSLVERYGDEWTSHLTDQGGQGTSGMYRVANWTPETKSSGVATATLATNPHYFGAKPRLTEVVVYFEFLWAEPNAIARLYDETQADVLPEQCIGVQGDPQCHATPSLTTYSIALNWSVPPYDDVRVRQALALALDKTKVAQLATGSATLATHRIVPLGLPGYTPTITGPLDTTALTGDPDRARALWLSYVHDRCGGNAARCPAFPMKGTFGGSADSALKEAEKEWQAALPGMRILNLGFPHGQLEVEAGTPPACWISTLLVDGYTADYPDPQNFLRRVTPTQASANDCLREKAARKLLDEATRTQDTTSRALLYAQAEQTLVNEVALIPLYQPQYTWEMRPSVVGYPATPWLWVDPWSWANIYIAVH